MSGTDAEDARRRLEDRIRSGEVEVGVLGLGYVGLPVAAAFAEAGLRTAGFDIQPRVVETVNAGGSHVEDVSPDRIASLVEAELLAATDDFDRLGGLDVILICVPTPLSKSGDPDVSHIKDAAEAIRDRLRPGQLVILESTTYPGTTREVVREILEETGLVAGRDFHLAFSPERIDPGNREWTLTNTPKVVAGLTPACHELAVAFYRKAVEEVVEVSSPEAAELTKLLENTFRAVNIALANEMAVVADRLGVDIWEVIDAADTKPYGFMRFTPGPGLGGHCIPVDPQYLAWRMKAHQYKTRFIDVASDVNAGMPRYVVEKVIEALNDERKAVRGSRVLMLGVAYKANVGDVRESPALEIMRLLADRGAELSYHDPHVPDMWMEPEMFASVPLAGETLREADCVVVTAAHEAVDWDLVAREAPLVVDARNVLGDRVAAGRVYPLAGRVREPGETTGPARAGGPRGESGSEPEREEDQDPENRAEPMDRDRVRHGTGTGG